MEQDYVSPITIGAINESYDTSGLEVNSMGKFTSASVDRAFVGKGRKTSRIIEDVIEQSRGRRSILIFAATQQHAKECMDSLPPGLSAMVTDKTPSAEREKIVKDFTDCKLRYLVNVSIFTRGTDFPRLDVIALLRATESSALLHQIIGRGVRKAEGKDDCLLLDYASNIENHHPDSDLFNPRIKAYKAKESGSLIIRKCPQCGVDNEFSARQNDEGFGIDKQGFFTDLDGNRITSEYGDMPAHYGRRCMGLHRQPNGKHEQCDYRYTFKPCHECNAENDIAARHCSSCKAEMVDPNRLLVAEFRARKRDPGVMQCDRILSWSFNKTLSGAGNEVLKVDFTTEYRSFSVWYQIRSSNKFLIKQYEALIKATQGLEVMPDTVTYRKETSGFYNVYAYGQDVDSI